MSKSGAAMTREFEDFHRDNPHVYAELRRLALELVDAGATRVGMKMLFEVLRWSQMRTTGEDFKLNNDLTAPYARLLMDREPRLAGVFETRRSRVDMPPYVEVFGDPQGVLL